MQNKFISILMFCFFNILFLKYSFAEVDPYILPRVVAVENKIYEPKYDLTFNLGVLPLDAFYKGYVAGLSYTHNINSYLSWEVLNGMYSENQDTGLKKDLIDNFDVEPTGILDSVNYLAVSSIVYTPIYSKNLFFNTTVRHGSLSFVGGAGTIQYLSGDSGVLFGGGLILRFFSSKLLSYKLDTRLYGHTAENKSSNLLLLIAFGFSFDFASEKN
jgi:outer membrane beta-barrel protein